MSKRKKTKKKRVVLPASNPKSQDVADWRMRLESFVQSKNWPKALSIALDLNRVENRTEEDVRRSMAVAEAGLRDLIAVQKNKHFAAVSRTIQTTYPEWVTGWPLGLQVAAGAVPDLDERLREPAFLERLRVEIRDPVELAWSDHPKLREEALTIIQAWDGLERRDFFAARRALQGVGRRSPLADWRLLLQAIIAGHLGDQDGVQEAVRRMTDRSPAKRVAALWASGVESDTPLPDLQAFVCQPTLRKQAEALLQNAKEMDDQALTCITQQAWRWHEAGRYELASTALIAYVNRIEGKENAALFNRVEQELLALDLKLGYRFQVRDAMLLRDELPWIPVHALSEAFFDPHARWSRHEHAVLGLLFCRTLLHLENTDLPDDIGMPPELLNVLQNPEVRIQAIKHILEEWPELDELYEIWHTTECDLPHNPCEALTHWVRHDPDNVELLIRCISNLSKNGRYKRAEAALERLQKFPGERQEYQRLCGELWLEKYTHADDNHRPGVIQKALQQLDQVPPNVAARFRGLHVLWSNPTATEEEILDLFIQADLNPWLALPEFGSDTPLQYRKKAVMLLQSCFKKHRLDGMEKWLQVMREDHAFNRMFECRLMQNEAFIAIAKKVTDPHIKFEVLWVLLEKSQKSSSLPMHEILINQLVCWCTEWLRDTQTPHWHPVAFGALSFLLHCDFIPLDAIRTSKLQEWLLSAASAYPRHTKEMKQISTLIERTDLHAGYAPLKPFTPPSIEVLRRCIERVRTLRGLISKTNSLQRNPSTGILKIKHVKKANLSTGVQLGLFEKGTAE